MDAAETLAYLIEVDVHLQNIAAISDQIVCTLSDYFKYPGSPPDATLMPTTKVKEYVKVVPAYCAVVYPTVDVLNWKLVTLAIGNIHANFHVSHLLVFRLAAHKATGQGTYCSMLGWLRNKRALSTGPDCDFEFYT